MRKMSVRLVILSDKGETSVLGVVRHALLLHHVLLLPSSVMSYRHHRLLHLVAVVRHQCCLPRLAIAIIRRVAIIRCITIIRHVLLLALSVVSCCCSWLSCLAVTVFRPSLAVVRPILSSIVSCWCPSRLAIIRCVLCLTVVSCRLAVVHCCPSLLVSCLAVL